MRLYIGTNYGRLNILKLDNKYLKKNYDIISDIQICSGIIEPILKIDDKFLLIGLEKKFIKIISSKNSKSFCTIECPGGEFNDLCSFQSLQHFVFAASKNFIYVWQKNLTGNWKMINKIISKHKIGLISNIFKSNLLITSNNHSYDVNLWNIFKTKLYFCGKATIKEKVIGIDGSPFNEYFAIRDIKGRLHAYTNKGLNINILSEEKNYKHKFGGFIQNSLKFYDENTFLTGGTSKNLSLWDLRINKIVQQWKGHTGEIKKIDIDQSSSDSHRYLAVSCDIFSTIKTWDMRMTNESHSFKFYSREINSIKLI
jgi:WD40 repeat protein